MPYRDDQGHFISEDEARRRGLTDEPETEEAETFEPPRQWAEEQREAQQPVFVDTGRGGAVEVQPGSSFEETLNRIADQANYGGYFRVFLNGSEVINPEDAPTTIEPGMRVAITSYDKVG